MERLKNITIIFLIAVGILGTVAFAKSSSTLLQEGLYAEQVDGDLDAAIEIYEKIIEDSSAQRSHIAQALYRQGMCYLKKQNESQAKAVFARVVEDYSDQTTVVNKVKPLLEELGNADPAALMPPETLIYVETGSPGRQIETILNMLKGTPFENPLAVLGAGKSQKSPGDMMAALFNPSMMAEFKKIRGMGIGVTGVAQNNPPMVAVLFPGKSDALRGLILAGLGMLGKPGEPIEGMDTLRIENVAGIAYDDRVVIIAQPIEQLTWSVKQYKGVISEPTLASTNKSFAKVSKKARQENALTLWANLDEVFAGLSQIIPEGHFPKEICMADGIADFKNIDDLIVFFNIQEDGIALEKNIAFKDEHNCIAYNMIRTPNLSRAGFEAVPSEAVGLLSLALGEAGSAQIAAASNSIKSLTGLDIGREIFANIEQINVFALPPSASKSNVTRPPIVGSLGLAITSHNPQQTRQLLTQLLTVANLVTGQTDIGQTGQGTGKYQVALVKNQPICCYMNQMDKTTVLSLDPDIVEASISAMKRRSSVCTAGPLNEAVRKLSPSTSKLLLVNVGGAIEIADSFLTATYKNPQNPAHKTLTQLSQACDKTSIQLGTDERINNFNVRLSIDQIPPLDNIFPLLMQISQTDPTAKAVATKPQPGKGATIGLKSVSKLQWKAGVNAKSHKIYFGTQADELPLLAEVESSSYDELPELEEGAGYCWRVDEVWADGTIITGDVWNFAIGKLAGWWKLDNDATDSSNNGNDGTVNGDPSWVDGRIGGALKLDGEDDYVDTGYKANLPVWTVAVWVNSPAAPKSTAPTGPVHREKNYQFNWNHSMGDFRGAAGISIGNEWYPASFGKLQGNTWYHLVATYDGEILKAYKDGDLITNNPAPSGAPDDENETLKLGMHAASTDCFGGTIDDVRIYSYALSKDEITALYNEGKQ